MAVVQASGGGCWPIILKAGLCRVGRSASGESRPLDSQQWNGQPELNRPFAVRSEVNAFGDRDGVVNFHAEISNCALKLGVAQQQLDGA